MSFPTPPAALTSASPTPAPVSQDPPPASLSTVDASLPDPSAFDILPALHELLSRLLASPSPPTAANGDHGGDLPTSTVDHAPAAVPAAQSSDHFPSAQPTYPNQQPLSIQHLAAEVSSIRNKIRRAREAVQALPDVDRRVEEQEREISKLTADVERQRAVLKALAVTASESRPT